MNRKLYIIGTGGFAKEVAQLASEIQQGRPTWTAIEYLCERVDEIGKPMPFADVTNTDDILERLDVDADFAIGIGIPTVRRRIATRLAGHARLKAPSLVHPLASLDPRHVRLGCGNLVTFGTAFTCDIDVGDFNVFNLNTTVGHDCRIGSFNVINPGCNISGNTKLADACLLGTGCQVLEGLSICSDVIIGGGALVTKSITEPGTYVGVPARLFK